MLAADTPILFVFQCLHVEKTELFLTVALSKPCPFYSGSCPVFVRLRVNDKQKRNKTIAF